jgi:sulfopyruvate decarboxylase subunit alpha
MVKAAGPHLQAIVNGICDAGITTFCHVPSSHAAPVIRGLEAMGLRAILANREEEAVGIVGGLRLAGVPAALVMQDNGFGNALTALTTFALAYHVPLPIFANVRGGLGEYNSMIQAISGNVPQLLTAVGIHVERLGPSDPLPVWRVTTRAAVELAEIQRRPVVTLFAALHPALEVAE